MKLKLIKREELVLEDFNKGVFRSIPDVKKAKKVYERIANNSLSKPQ